MKSFKNLKQRLLAKNPLKRFSDTSKNKKNVALKSVVNELNVSRKQEKDLSDLISSSGSMLAPLTTVTSATSASNALVKSATFANDLVSCDGVSSAVSYSMTSFQPTYFSYYVGVTVIAPDSNITGSASNCVGKIIQTVSRLSEKPKLIAFQSHETYSCDSIE